MEEFFIFAQGQWIPNTRMCSSMRKHVTLTLRTSLGEGWRNLSYFCRNNPFSGTISNVNNQVLYFLRLFPMQCLSVAKGGHCTIMHGRSATHDWSASDYTKPLHVMNEVIRKCVKGNKLIFGFYSLPVIFMIFSFFMVWLGSDFVCRLWGSMSHRWLCNAKIAIL